MMKLNKYSGAGNTFIILEENELPQKKINSLCTSYLTDGLILLQNVNEQREKRGQEVNPVVMRYFNADGYEADMCGNGLRCVIKYLWDQGIKQDIYTIITRVGLQKGMISGDVVTCFLQPPSLCLWDQKIIVEQKELFFDFMNTSVDHAVFFFEAHDVTLLGRKIRYHEYFSPKGTNVNFAKIEGDEIKLRTYERGVERETPACGTGAVATALAAAKKYHLSSPIKIKVQSNEILEIGFNIKNERFEDITLKGSATCVILDSVEN